MSLNKKLVSTFAILISLIFILSACGGEKTVSLEGEKLTYWAAIDSRTQQTLSTYNDMLFYKELNKATGIDVEFIHPSTGSTGAEAFQILLASGEYPDMIEYNWPSYAGGPDKAIEDGIIISLNEYLEDYAPNYYDYMEGDKAKENGGVYKAQTISDKGNYYGFAYLLLGDVRGYSGFYVRKDKLDEWGLDVPVTIDDWTELFEVAKANGIKRPFTCINTFFDFAGGSEHFNAAWKVGEEYYLDGSRVKFGPAEKSFKAYMEKMSEWMKLGYIDQDCVTNTSTEIDAYITGGESIATYWYVGGGIGKILPAMAEKDPNFDIVACPFPVLNEGDKAWAQEIEPEASLSRGVSITTQCGEDNPDRYKAAVKWLDYLYSEEGKLLKIFGVEGDTYTVENDEDGTEHYVYTDKIYDHEKIGAHSVEAALYHFMRPAAGPGFGAHPDYIEGFYPYQQQKDAIKVWNEPIDEARKHLLPPLVFTENEATKIATLTTNENDNINAAIMDYILGKISMEDYDKVIDTAMKNSYNELIKINQAAYDRYSKNLD